MSGYAVAQIDEIDEIDDGRVLRAPSGSTSGSRRSASTHLQLIRRAIGSSTSTTSHRSMTCRRSCTSSSEDARRSSSTASGWTHPRAHSSSFARGVKRTAFAEEPGTTLVAVGGTPGKAYEAQGGEIWCRSAISTSQGEYAEAADRGRELIEAHPEYAGPLYNLACCESLAGRTDRRDQSISGSRSTARNRSVRLLPRDSDFDPIRDEPAFKELVQGNAAEPTTG